MFPVLIVPVNGTLTRALAEYAIVPVLVKVTLK
jgi:hypothetical protein